MLIKGDARQLPLRDACVNCVVTSPPYYGLRNYGGDQIGQEPTPEVYVASLVQAFHAVRRGLKDDGTLWLNLGDTYSRKNLLGLPWRVAFALQNAGWWLRAEIIWFKPNALPEVVTDRPTRAHEHLFLLAKSERYWYDSQAIAEPVVDAIFSEDGDVVGNARVRADRFGGNKHVEGTTRHSDGSVYSGRFMRNRRSVWTVNTTPYTGAHFATMPEKLIEPCILAGCPLGGVVLDPFVGSGTVVAVAERLGRRGVGVDLRYQDLARERTAQRGLLFT